jgi:hypothetical protein
LAGTHDFIGFAIVNGAPVTFPISVNFVNPNAASATVFSTVITEGASSLLSIEVSLDQPAGETLELAWSVQPAGASPASAQDFFMSQLPTGIISFSRGETSKTFQINVTDDALQEMTETFRVSFEVAKGTLQTVPTAIDFAVRDNDMPGQNGQIALWTGFEPPELTLKILRSEIPITASEQTRLANIQFDKQSGVLTAELWSTEVELGQNFDLHFSLPKGAVGAFSAASALTGWTIFANGDSDSFDVAGISSQPLSGSASQLLGTVTFTVVSLGQMPSVTSGAVAGTSILPAEIYQTRNLTSSNGSLSFDALNGTYGAEDIYADTSKFTVDSRDALMAFKIATGELQADDLHSPLQITAADINANGTVTIMDAWLLLRHVVGIEDANVGRFGFVSSSSDLTNISATRSQPVSANKLTLLSDANFDATGYIIGDVDGGFLLL